VDPLDRPCIICYREHVETYVAFDGEPLWAVAGLVGLGVPEVEATTTVQLTLGENRGRFGTKVVLGKEPSLAPLDKEQVRVIFVVCQECADRIGTRVGPRGDVPCYLQAEYAPLED
jgi:hypothetical protein